MEARRLLPYIVGLIVLAFALGSLSRSQAGGSLLFRSYWLLYLIYLGPIAILGIMVALIVLITLNWRNLSEGIGYGLAKRRRRQRKPRSRLSFLVAAFFWALAIVVLYAKGCTPFCKNPSTNPTLTTQIVGEKGTTSQFPVGDALPVLANLVQTNWFSFAFLGLLVVSGLVLIQSIRVSMRGTRDVNPGMFPGSREEGLEAVQEALKLVDDVTMDPRSRIIACYQHLITSASGMGAPVSSDQTARELENGIQTMFALHGPAIHRLTELFEEARYSLHPITERDAQRGYEYLQSIARELNILITAQP